MSLADPGPAPFDTAAASYDRSFTERPVARLLREAVREHLLEAFRPGTQVLELGCGTGEDAVMLARHGIRVTAVDASRAMLEVARKKVTDADVGDRVELRWLDVAQGALPPAPVDGRFDGGRGTANPRFDGAFSNFGALNCVEDRRKVAEGLARRLRPGAPALLVVMGPFCPWEMAWHLGRLRPGTALRRLRPGREARVGESTGQSEDPPPREGDPRPRVRVWYPTPRRLAADFRPWFRRRDTRGLGVVLPPPGLSPVVEARAGLRRRLAAWDRRLGRRFPGTWLNDHYLLHLERREEGP